ncbi:hypothetical protein T484DRAFT_1801821 [Baffinella frigidus]|nr:hypothetical protein T484DRAFT_1801821 [Cryptophyta sp. CCMP2293]
MEDEMGVRLRVIFQEQDASLAAMEDEMGVRLRVISQEQEASLGWACVNDQFRDQGVGEIVVWDSGGGSFQVSGFEMGRHTSWLRDVGSASTLATLVRSVQGCSLADTASPNPVSVEQAQAQALARALQVQIVGFGVRVTGHAGVHEPAPAAKSRWVLSAMHVLALKALARALKALARALKVQIGAPPGSLEMKLSAPGVRYAP